jgi:hypothetical protein
MDIVRERLHNQLITNARFADPGEVVRWLGAVQAQDYRAGLWAVGLRIPGSTEATVERAVAERRIVRTWPMRGTLHFVAPEDARWMLELLTPRVVAASAGRYRQLELDDATLARGRRAVEKTLRGGMSLSRPALYRMLDAAGVSTAGQRGLHILGWLAQKGVICFGARDGKQQTFALLDEWVPESRSLARDEALAELAARYVASHGPATAEDFSWWTGLPLRDARAAVESVASRFLTERIGRKTYWFPEPSKAKRPRSPDIRLLPVYDEYLVGYRDRGAALDPVYATRAGNGIFKPIVLVDGRVAGTWTKATIDEPDLFVAPPGRAEARAIAAAAERNTRFVDGSGS